MAEILGALAIVMLAAAAILVPISWLLGRMSMIEPPEFISLLLGWLLLIVVIGLFLVIASSILVGAGALLSKLLSNGNSLVAPFAIIAIVAVPMVWVEFLGPLVALFFHSERRAANQ